MSDEKNKKDDGWAMPEPVFQSSEGRDVRADDDLQSDIPTEPADRDFTTEASINIGSQSIRPKANRHIRHKNKKKKAFGSAMPRASLS